MLHISHNSNFARTSAVEESVSAGGIGAGVRLNQKY